MQVGPMLLLELPPVDLGDLVEPFKEGDLLRSDGGLSRTKFECFVFRYDLKIRLLCHERFYFHIAKSRNFCYENRCLVQALAI